MNMIKQFCQHWIPSLTVSAEKGSDANFCHLHKHISYLFGDMSEHVSTQFGFAGSRIHPSGILF